VMKFRNEVLLFILTTSTLVFTSNQTKRSGRCSSSGEGRLQYLWGDALTPSPCDGPDGTSYPFHEVELFMKKSNLTHLVVKRSPTIDPHEMRNNLLDGWLSTNEQSRRLNHARNIPGEGNYDNKSYNSRCSIEGSTRLCSSEINTTAPLFGKSMTSGKTVAIIQKFPNFLQQVVYDVCESAECKVLRGHCTQTFTPFLFVTIPNGPASKSLQTQLICYVLVESGCVCRLPEEVLQP
ncbi:uncharacterized protein LOC106476716, partial [Limulus polyphemus]|uniref:Uncharacterized protein LOC106476716 n=1 Tax=Limulus polyphemus TaxID=6850 RepID=A0ABM1RXV8_LIMPO